MRRYFAGLGFFIAVALAPPAFAGPLPPVHNGGAAVAGPVTEVSHHRSCHRDVQNHSHRGHGFIRHRHVGARCTVQRVRGSDRRYHKQRRHYHHDRRDGGCIRMGDARICF